MDDKSTSIILRAGVHILVTEEDKTGEDILTMSDFFGGYVQQLTDAIRTNAVTTYKVGESKQIDGNLRAVIVDETGTEISMFRFWMHATIS